jgi:hypothetical protein
MTRFVNTKNGVVVDVDDDTASRLAADYVAEADHVAPVEPVVVAPVKRGRPKKETSEELAE